MRSVQTEVAHFPTVPLKQREKFRDCVSHLVVVFWSWLRRVSLLGNTREFPILNFRNMFHKWTKGCGCLPDKTIYGVIMNRNSWLRMMRCIKTSDFPPLWLQNVLTNTCLYFLLLLSKNIFIQHTNIQVISPPPAHWFLCTSGFTERILHWQALPRRVTRSVTNQIAQRYFSFAIQSLNGQWRNGTLIGSP